MLNKRVYKNIIIFFLTATISINCSELAVLSLKGIAYGYSAIMSNRSNLLSDASTVLRSSALIGATGLTGAIIYQELNSRKMLPTFDTVMRYKRPTLLSFLGGGVGFKSSYYGRKLPSFETLGLLFQPNKEIVAGLWGVTALISTWSENNKLKNVLARVQAEKVQSDSVLRDVEQKARIAAGQLDAQGKSVLGLEARLANTLVEKERVEKLAADQSVKAEGLSKQLTGKDALLKQKQREFQAAISAKEASLLAAAKQEQGQLELRLAAAVKQSDDLLAQLAEKERLQLVEQGERAKEKSNTSLVLLDVTRQARDFAAQLATKEALLLAAAGAKQEQGQLRLGLAAAVRHSDELLAQLGKLREIEGMYYVSQEEVGQLREALTRAQTEKNLEAQRKISVLRSCLAIFVGREESDLQESLGEHKSYRSEGTLQLLEDSVRELFAGLRGIVVDLQLQEELHFRDDVFVEPVFSDLEEKDVQSHLEEKRLILQELRERKKALERRLAPVAGAAVATAGEKVSDKETVTQHRKLLFEDNLEDVRRGLEYVLATEKNFNTLHTIQDTIHLPILSFAVFNQRINIVNFFLQEKDVAVDVQNQTGNTPFQFAVIKENAAIARLLLAHGANVNAQDERGKTALHYAVYYQDRYRKIKCGSEMMIQFLLAHGAGVNIQDVNGKTALHFAVLRTQEEGPEALNLLLANGADIDIGSNGKNETALEYARRKKQQRAIELLEAAAAKKAAKE